ncbi:putative protein phosphatase 2C 52 [Hibiscus syriacus]|uniref:PPM-type phosphatase domain-containing protein n=1 Tax=Hibiscus syriacus TaxID=106335 RepID=A0A6A3AHX4_HIBSY|nr:putative protein phosphatase 2C 52 [Hibiscus syriacus]
MGVVSPQVAGVIATPGATGKWIFLRVLMSDVASQRELRERSRIMLSDCSIYPRPPTGFSQMERVAVPAYSLSKDFMPEDATFCGVFDGHGPYGHLIARKVRDALPLKLLSSLHSCQSRQNGTGQTCFKGSSKKKVDGGDSEKDVSAEERLTSLWREAFMKSYKVMDKELRSHSNLDCFCSGSTVVSIVKQGSNLFMGYVGDSRAVMGSKDSNDLIVTVQLTVDLKPDLPREAERIKKCKGRVFALQEEPEEYGVISMPEFSHRILTERDQFIVLASDGIVSLAPSRSFAARILVDSAAREWKLKYPTSKMDDCAAFAYFWTGKWTRNPISRNKAILLQPFRVITPVMQVNPMMVETIRSFLCRGIVRLNHRKKARVSELEDYVLRSCKGMGIGFQVKIKIGQVWKVLLE